LTAIRLLFAALYHRPGEGEALSLGPGAFVAALEAACHRDASSTTVCGKPSEAFLQECIAGMIRDGESMNEYTNIIVSQRDETNKERSSAGRNAQLS